MQRFSEKYIITKGMEWEELGGGVSAGKGKYGRWGPGAVEAATGSEVR